MSRPRRVAVTAPPEPGVRCRPAPARGITEPLLDPERTALARAMRRAQLRRAAITLGCGVLLLFGAPAVLRAFPELAAWRGTGLPFGWIVVAWVPFPLLAVLAFWHLRRAERAEQARGTAGGGQVGAEVPVRIGEQSKRTGGTGPAPAP